jgi:translation elongation factor EF-Ts
MKGPTIEEVKALQQETGEGMMACKKILVDRVKAEEKKEIISLLYKLDVNEDLLKVLGYLVRNV